MKIAIVGSRGFTDLNQVSAYVRALPPGTIIVSGGAMGVDRAAENAAKRAGMETKIFPANWPLYGKRAGYLRNVDIVTTSDRVVAFWDGQSKGTLHSIELARKQRKPLEIFTPTANWTETVS